MASQIAQEHFLETYKSLISIATEAFKYSALINGGAVVAILAYLGDVTAQRKSPPDMSCAIAAFLVGLSACGAAMFVAYLTQLQLLQESRQVLDEGRLPSFEPHKWYLRASMLFYFLSLAGFVVGSWWAIRAFR